jgi:hypothetical protein
MVMDSSDALKTSIKSFLQFLHHQMQPVLYKFLARAVGLQQNIILEGTK